MANKEWNQENREAAFTAVLSKSGHDRGFRDKLTASLESARQAVSTEGQIDIPEDVVIVFHEDELNEKYHVFDLPPFDPDKRDDHSYHELFMCCYNAWRPPVVARTRDWTPENAVPAFTAALTRAGHDSDFREQLKASAREGVTEEGKIDIPEDIVMVFRDTTQREKYYSFHLPPFDASNTTVKHEYAAHFELD